MESCRVYCSPSRGIYRRSGAVERPWTVLRELQDERYANCGLFRGRLRSDGRLGVRLWVVEFGADEGLRRGARNWQERGWPGDGGVVFQPLIGHWQNALAFSWQPHPQHLPQATIPTSCCTQSLLHIRRRLQVHLQPCMAGAFIRSMSQLQLRPPPWPLAG